MLSTVFFSWPVVHTNMSSNQLLLRLEGERGEKEKEPCQLNFFLHLCSFFFIESKCYFFYKGKKQIVFRLSYNTSV